MASDKSPHNEYLANLRNLLQFEVDILSDSTLVDAYLSWVVSQHILAMLPTDAGQELPTEQVTVQKVQQIKQLSTLEEGLQCTAYSTCLHGYVTRLRAHAHAHPDHLPDPAELAQTITICQRCAHHIQSNVLDFHKLQQFRYKLKDQQTQTLDST